MDYHRYVKVYEDYPQEGVSFKDFTPIYTNSWILNEAINDLARQLIYSEVACDYIIAPESRGFIAGSALSFRLTKGFIPARKNDRLMPGDVVISDSYKSEYGKDLLKVSSGLLKECSETYEYRKPNIVIYDDLLATGNTAISLANLSKQYFNVSAFVFLGELNYLNGQELIYDAGYNVPIISLIKFGE